MGTLVTIWVLVILMNTPSGVNSSNAAAVTIDHYSAASCDKAMLKALRMSGTYTAYCLPSDRPMVVRPRV